MKEIVWKRILLGFILFGGAGLFLLTYSCAPKKAAKKRVHIVKVRQSPFIRVAISKDKSFTFFYPDTFFVYGPEKMLFKGMPGTYRVWFYSREGPFKLRFYALIATTYSLDSAVIYKTLWETKGYNVVVKRWGKLFKFEAETVDAREYAIFVGPYKEKSEITRDSELKGRAIFREVYEKPRIWLELTDSKGTPLLKIRSFLRVIPNPRGVHYFTILNFKPGIKFIGQRISSRNYLGILEFVPIPGDSIILIDELPLEEYLKGVVPAEMIPTFPEEALMAQAVVARTYALFKWKKGQAFFENYDLNGDISAQAYTGLENKTSETDWAVWRTRGVIVEYNGRPIEALYHTCCGGRTESSKNVFGKDIPYLRSVFCGRSEFQETIGSVSLSTWLRRPPASFCNPGVNHLKEAKKCFRWSVTISPEELRYHLIHTVGKDIGKITSIEVLKRGESGRALKIKINGTRGSVAVSGEYNIRRALHDPPLLSSLIQIDFVRAFGGLPSEIIITGGGSGHGVGMCQIGAAGMAKMGYTYDQILSKYYPGTYIIKVY